MSEAQSIDDGRPIVGEDRGNRSLWLGLGAIGLCGVLLFTALEGNRASSTQPQISPPTDYATASIARPELVIPPPPAPAYVPGYLGAGDRPLLANRRTDDAVKLPPVRLTRTRPPVNINPPLPTSNPASYSPPVSPLPANPLPVVPDPGRSAPGIVYDIGRTDAAPASTSASITTGAIQATKAIAVGGGDRTYLVSQGTLIAAVLETAIDSTQSGQVRAMISKDVYNALGTRVLVPKGSRIFGEYKGELSAGQNRAQIIWTRLIRPDGATIALDSPASDLLGRAGVKGRVNTHFGQRLLNALLQSTINFGTFAASRAVSSNNGVILALPADAQNVGSQILPEVPKPTLRVRHGTRISVFVARDLDFAAVE